MKLSKSTVQKILANSREVPKNREADLFVAFRIGARLYVNSTGTILEKKFIPFWRRVAEWAWVDMTWWCEDRKIAVEVLRALKPVLYHINAGSGTLTPVLNDSTFRKIARSKDRMGKRFAYLERGPLPDKVARALLKHYRAVYGKDVPKGFRIRSISG